MSPKFMKISVGLVKEKELKSDVLIKLFCEALVHGAGKNGVNGSLGGYGDIDHSKMRCKALCLECQTVFSARRNQQSNAG